MAFIEIYLFLWLFVILKVFMPVNTLLVDKNSLEPKILDNVSLSFSASASLQNNYQSECCFLLSSSSVLSHSEASILSVKVN